MDQSHDRDGIKLQDIPFDLACETFGHLNTSDLLHVAQSSRALFGVAITLLYRSVQYNSLVEFTKNASFWDHCQGHFLGMPRAVAIGPDFGQRLTLNDCWNGLRSRLVSFTNLRALSFEKAVLPLEFYEFLPALANLRILSLQECTLHCAVTAPELVPFLATRSLPVSELTLLNNSALFPSSPSQPLASTTPGLVYRDPLYLIRQSPHLRALCMNWTLHTVRRFSEDDGIPTPAFAYLEYLELRLPVDFKAGRYGNHWRVETRRVLMETLHLVLSSCSVLTELVLLGSVDRVVANYPSTSTAAVIPALKRYTGDVVFLKSKLSHCVNLETVILSNRLKDVSSAIQSFSCLSSNIRHLEIMVAQWHMEIMHAVTSVLPGLRELRISYTEGFPTEDNLISFGTEFFVQLPKLSVFHCYQDYMIPGLDLGPLDHSPLVSDNVADLLTVWQIDIPELRELRLDARYAWRRAYVGDTWYRRDLGI